MINIYPKNNLKFNLSHNITTLLILLFINFVYFFNKVHIHINTHIHIHIHIHTYIKEEEGMAVTQLTILKQVLVVPSSTLVLVRCY